MTLEVRKWLEENGLGQYGDLFEANEIDGEALLALTDAHLRELAIPLGPRAKMVKALEQLARRAAPAQAIAAEPAPSPYAAPERRQLTVMFVDLVGSTALSGRIDPEDLRKVIRSYQSVVAREVARYEGLVAQYLGDGVLAYFGYPTAHENDAERAVRSALAILEAVPLVGAPVGDRLAARIGIATGLVVVGDMIGEGGSKEHAVVGETPNLAARLQSLAQPGEAVLSARTLELVGDVFEVRDLGVQTLKGMASAVSAHAVVRARPVESRFEARRAGGLSRMVGRDEELAMLVALWRKALDGAAQCVLLSGEAGIGKSRLLRALQDALGAEPHLRIHYQCSPFHSGSALFPVIQQLQRAAQLDSSASVDASLDRLEQLFAPASARSVSDTALIAALLGIDGSARYGPLPLTPAQQRTATFHALIRQLLRVATQQPVLLLVEDAHWIDPTTQELVELCFERLGSARVLLVVTARPDFAPDWSKSVVARVLLQRLGRLQIAEITQEVARGALPEELLAEIVSKTDGVPLFVEEFTKTVLESGVLQQGRDGLVAGGTVQGLAVPSSLRDSLMARLDRLQPIKEVAQIAACIGREFGPALLAAVAPLDEGVLRDALERLVGAELLFRKGPAEAAQYVFKHALVRDAAYESLLKEKRQQIHSRLVTALARGPGIAPEVIAQHATSANLTEVAIEHWQKAAMQAIARTAYKEAIAHLTRAIGLAEQAGEESAWLERRLLLLITLGQASIPLRGYGHPETAAAFERAQGLVERIGGAPHRFPIFYAVWVVSYVRGEQDKALDTARHMVEQAEREGNSGHLLTSLRSLAMSQMITGAPAVALGTFERAQRLAETLPQRSRAQRIATADRFANDPEIGTQVHLAYALWAVGKVEEARRLADETIAAARSLGHAHTLCHVLSYVSMLIARCGGIDEALALSAEAMQLDERHEFDMLLGYASVVNGFALSVRGENETSAERMASGLARLARTHGGTTRVVFHAIQARTLASLGRLADAEEHAGIVRAELRTGSERYYWSECHRFLGDYLRLRPERDLAAVEAAYRDALAVARAQDAKTWEVLAALSLARLWIERGEAIRAQELLAPLRAQFGAPSALPAIAEIDAILAARTA